MVFGTTAAVQAALAKSMASRRTNTSFMEPKNDTDRHHNARKVCKAYTFSTDCGLRLISWSRRNGSFPQRSHA